MNCVQTVSVWENRYFIHTNVMHERTVLTYRNCSYTVQNTALYQSMNTCKLKIIYKCTRVPITYILYNSQGYRVYNFIIGTKKRVEIIRIYVEYFSQVFRINSKILQRYLQMIPGNGIQQVFRSVDNNDYFEYQLQKCAIFFFR